MPIEKHMHVHTVFSLIILPYITSRTLIKAIPVWGQSHTVRVHHSRRKYSKISLTQPLGPPWGKAQQFKVGVFVFLVLFTIAQWNVPDERLLWREAKPLAFELPFKWIPGPRPISHLLGPLWLDFQDGFKERSSTAYMWKLLRSRTCIVDPQWVLLEF